MAEAASGTKPAAAAPEAGTEKAKKKKARPTNCLQSNKRIRRKDWYYRDGNYFANKQCFKLWAKQEAEKAMKAKETAAATGPADKPAEEKTA